MSENITIAIIAAFGGGIVVSLLSFWIDIWRNSIKNKIKKKYYIRAAYSELLDTKNYLKHSVDLIRYTIENKDNKDINRIDLIDIRRQIESISFNKIQHLYEDIFLKPVEFDFAKKIYQVKEIKSYLQLQADLTFDKKKTENDFFKIVEDCYNEIKIIKKFSLDFLKKQKLN